LLAAYPAAATDRHVSLVAVLAIAAWALLAVALVGSWEPVVAVAVAIFGAEYAVFLRLRGGVVDSRAPFVAAGLIVVAELAFHVVSGRRGRAQAGVVARSLLLRVGAAGGAAIAGGIVLVAAGSVRSGLALEALAVLAAAIAVGAVIRVASRTRESTSSSA
jgi:nitrate reductase NapE component